jgi:hypothetical protein
MMAEQELPTKLKFHQNHKPTMDSGEYAITIAGKVTHALISKDNSATTTSRFAVFGERFYLNPKDIRAVFPSAGSTGAYADVLPHIIFNRNTLPWERHALAANKDLPWMALLLFDENEVPAKKTITVKELWSTTAGAGFFPPLAKEVAQHDDEKLTVIDVSKTVLQKIAPSTDSLKFLAHTRQGVNDNEILVGEENAVVFCNRLPEQGKRSTLHLVSFEGRYNDTGFNFPAGVDLFRLVSLKTWEFYTTEHFKITQATLDAIKAFADSVQHGKMSTLLDREFAGTEAHFIEEITPIVGTIPDTYKAIFIKNAQFNKTFDGLLLNLNKDLLTLRLPVNQNPVAEQYLSQGLVPLVHHFRNGDQSVSWYRSPFLPYKSLEDGRTIRNLHPESADELSRYDADRGLFDITYSAAWEIGRLLALSSKDFSVSLYQWKHLIAQHDHKTHQMNDSTYLPVFIHPHDHAAEAPLWTKHLQPWLTQLSNFQSIPANYLVPDEQLLPKEAIRFFYIDKDWQVAALSGAFSVGGTWDAHYQTDVNEFNTFLELKDTYQMGFLLRSDVVDGWPGLSIDGIDQNEQKQMPLTRLLSKDILLCLFKTDVKKVIFHQKTEVMHFGLSPLGKKARNTEGDEIGEPIPIEWQSTKADRVVNIAQLAIKLGKAQQPAQFAMNMIEGSARVIFNFVTSLK